MSFYTVSSVQKLIDEYIEAGGSMLQMREGTLGCGDALLYDTAEKMYTFVIHEVALNEWSSGQTVRKYRKIPEKYRKMIEEA